VTTRPDMAEDSFLRRWSRRKHESARQESRTEPAAPSTEPPAPAAPAAPVAAPAAQGPPAELPPLESLKGLASDYREYLDPAVDESLRRSALKKLFHDPHFNVMDGLDVYIDDYSKPDPIPESMLKDLLARHFVFPDPASQTAKAETDEHAAESRGPDPALPVPESVPAESAPGPEAAPAAPVPAEESKR